MEVDSIFIAKDKSKFSHKYLFLTSKPSYLLSQFIRKRLHQEKKINGYAAIISLIKIKEWVDKNDPGAFIIPFSGVFEQKLVEEYSDAALRKKFLEDNNTNSYIII
ncbi:hypothetical protein NQ317_014554 [Molorchus minor]|uniref:Uncharacterized protein n=1 Tax=Molorchus minor TaxID=1323400 RepID=A0ABQ9JJ78_9CUCU|nr:hypothetical protein NQ317_014554 [Molorchus minor]